MKKNHTISLSFRKTLVFLVMLFLHHLASAQKKDQNNTATLPTETVVVSAKNDKIRKQIIKDWQDQTKLVKAINNGINHQLLTTSSERTQFRMDNRSVGIFYISKNTLLDLLYDNDATQGFNLFFTKFDNEIVLVKADSNFKNIENNFIYLNTTGKAPSSLTSTIKHQSLSEIRKEYKYYVKSYFIGRHCIMKNFTDLRGGFLDEAVGVSMDVRANNKNSYSIIFTLVNSDKSTTYLGMATRERVVPIGGGASSRPCPTHCPEE